MPERVDPQTEALQVETDQFYIRTETTATDELSLVLKEGDTFVVLDRHGEIPHIRDGKEGLYHGGTRFLSRLTLSFGDGPGLLLGAAVRGDNAAIVRSPPAPGLLSTPTAIVGSTARSEAPWMPPIEKPK